MADAKGTFNCGLSPICLYAPSQHTTIYKRVLNVESESADLTISTLRLEYAVQVWMRAALISANNSGRLLYYWWLNYQDNETSFREIKYNLKYAGITMETLINDFWKLLENVANSGEITVHEGFSYSNQNNIRGHEPALGFRVVLNIEDASKAYELIDDIHAYPYDYTSKTYT